MKKILAFALAVVAVLSLAGCMGAGSNATTATDPTNPESIKYEDYDYSIMGICQYLDDLGYMVFDYDASKDEAGKATIKMQADMIGAEEGYKSRYTYDGKQWGVEVYYYADTKSDFYKQAKSGKVTVTEEIEDGSFEITVNNNFGIVIHEPKDGEERQAKIIEAFNNFYPKGAPKA